MIALQYHEVKINIELASLTEISYIDTVSTVADTYTGVAISNTVTIDEDTPANVVTLDGTSVT